MGDWASIGDAIALQARGLFVAEGRRVIGRILAGAAGGPDAIVSVLATPAAAEALDLGRLGARLEVQPPATMQALTGFNFHRGALALVRRPPSLAAADVIAAGAARRASAAGGRLLYVVGERIADADNVGSLFRNAQAFGAGGVLLDDRSADPLYRKAVRTSLGAVLTVPWTQAPMPDLMAALQTAGLVGIGLTPDPAAAPLERVAASAVQGEPLALLVGNEGDGLSAATLAACERLARIPMAPSADSLNVATALAVGLYAFSR